MPAALPAPHVVTCSVGKAKLPAHCGTVTVYENRVARTGRTIALNLIEIDAAHHSGRAIFWNPGGPGGDDASDVPDIANGVAANELMALRDRYDLVFVDSRGTGASHPLQCDLFSTSDLGAEYRRIFPEGPLRACRSRLARNGDLSMYTTDLAADDVDDVRAALGYRRIVLDGDSYGTMLYLDYARRHPAHVESLVLQGVAPPGMLIPLEDAAGAQRALDDLFDDCRTDHACRRDHPQLAAHFATLARRVEAGDVSFDVRGAVGHTTSVTLTKQVFADRLRQALYASESAAYVPYVVDSAYAGRYKPLAELVDVVTKGFAGVAIGLNLSTTCAEDVPFITDASVARSSAGTFEGDARVRAQQRACTTWDVARAPRSFLEPVRSSAPVLMISGASDPATPPRYGRAELAYLPNGRQIVVPHAGHETESACTDALIVRFVRERDAKQLDATRCVETAHRPPFATSMRGFGD